MRPAGRTSLMLATICAALLLAAGAAFAAVLNGTDGPDELVGTAEADELYGREGGDTVYGMSGSDRVEGNLGNDTLFGGDEAGTGAGDDTVIGDWGNDSITGGPGADYLAGGPEDDNILEGPINDAADDRVFGGAGADSIETTNDPASKDTVSCGDGVDQVEADALDDVAADCENVERMNLEEGEEDTLPTDPAPGGEYTHYYAENVRAFGNEYVPPHFDVYNNYRVIVDPSYHGGDIVSYKAFAFQDGKCTYVERGNSWRYVRVGDRVRLYSNGSGSKKEICIKANVRSASSQVIKGHFREKRGL